MVQETRILVVDDNPCFRKALMVGISSLGFKNIGVAIDGEDALRQLQEQAFDLVISDRKMPRMNGFALLASMKNDTTLKNIPFILMSALDERSKEQVRAKAIQLGAVTCMQKTEMGGDHLRDVIHQALGMS